MPGRPRWGRPGTNEWGRSEAEKNRPDVVEAVRTKCNGASCDTGRTSGFLD